MMAEVLHLNEGLRVAAVFGLGALCVVFPTALLLGVPLYCCHVRFRGRISSWLGVYLLVGAIGPARGPPLLGKSDKAIDEVGAVVVFPICYPRP